MRYRKKPAEIEALQFNRRNGWEIEKWSDHAVVPSPVLEPMPDNPTGAYLQIHTLEGTMIAIVGDWVIRGVKGEYYPCKPDIFEMTYGPAEDAPPTAAPLLAVLRATEEAMAECDDVGDDGNCDDCCHDERSAGRRCWFKAIRRAWLGKVLAPGHGFNSKRSQRAENGGRP